MESNFSPLATVISLVETYHSITVFDQAVGCNSYGKTYLMKVYHQLLNFFKRIKTMPNTKKVHNFVCH